MLKIVASIFLILGYSFFSLADDSEVLNACYVEARKCAETMIDGNYKALVECTPTPVVESVGGLDKMIKLIETGRVKMREKGFDFLSVAVDFPKKLEHTTKNYFVIVPTILTMKTPEGKMHQKSYLVGASPDGKKNWKFADGAGLDEKKIKLVYPDFPKSVELPPKVDPTYTH